MLAPALGSVLLLGLAATADGGSGSLQFQRLTLDEGLSQSTVFDAVQDRRGFMWFGTQDGLNRYDGHRFKIYRHDPHNANSPSSNVIQSLHLDATGAIWLGTTSGLDRLDPAAERFTRYRWADGASGRSHADVQDLTADAAGVLWIATLGGGLRRLDPASGETFVYRHDPADPDSLSDDRTRFVLADRDGAIWVGTEGGGLNRLSSGGGFTVFRHDPSAPRSLPHDTVSCGFQDASGARWFGTDGGLVRFEPEAPRGGFTRYRPEPGDPTSLSAHQVRALYEDRAGGFWVGTKDGLNRMDRESGAFVRLRHEPGNPSSLSDGFVRTVFQDRSGLIWIGTDGRGLNTFDPLREGFVTFRHLPDDPRSLSADMIWSIYEDRQDVLWVGTWGRGLNRFDDATGAFRRFVDPAPGRDPLAANIIHDIHDDHAGTLWLGTDDGLAEFDLRTGRFAVRRSDPADPTSLSGNTVRMVFEDSARRLWIGTDDGLNRLERATGGFTRFAHDPADPRSLSDNAIWTMLEASSGDLWIGTGEGLNRLRPGEEGFSRHGARNDALGGLSNQFIRALHEDRRGRLWVGTDDGLNLFDPASDTATVYGERQGLPNNVIYGILEDGAGRLWLSTNRGLSRFDPESGAFRNFDKRDGLQGNEFNRGAYWRRRSGEMLFGGIDGLTAFFPERIRDNDHVPPVVLTSVRLFGREVALDPPAAEMHRLEVSHRQNVLTFEFAALDYHAPEKNRYTYQLQGFSQAWIDLGTKRDVTFTNLDPGRYTLRVRGSNNDGVWNERGLRIELTVTPPFWATSWFRMLVALATLLLLAGSYRLRTRAIRRRNLALEAEIRQRQRAEAAQRQLIDELEEKSREIETKNLELETTNAELEQFAYTVSHDLRSPLVTIKGYLGLLGRDARSGDLEAAAAHVGVIDSAADTMRRLLDELLELSRIGRVESSPEMVPLSEAAESALTLVAGSIRERGARVIIDPEMPAAWCDRARIVEVFQNLIENAVKFSAGPAAPRVEVGAELAGGEARCFVRDRGIGIAERHRERVFGLFERLDPQVEGTGVGLALVKRIVESHGGRIWVESGGEDRGSTFWFTLPTPTIDGRGADGSP